MMDEKPVVAHLMRLYLAHTETFIGNQIYSLTEYSPLVLCHHRKDFHGYPKENIYCVREHLSKPDKIFDMLAYRACRLCLPQVTNALELEIRARQARLIHYHYLVDARFFIDVKRRTGLPALASGYGYDVSHFPRWFMGYGKIYLKKIFGLIDYFLAMSNDMKKDMVSLGCPESKIIVHYYGTDTRRFQFPARQYGDKDCLTILVCGSLDEKKAQHLTLEALRIVEKERLSTKKFQVILAGSGPLRSRLERQVKEYGWENQVNFLGFVPHQSEELPVIYRQADIFSHPSITVEGRKEGIPGTIVEAMSSGLPVLSSYHAGIPEVITSGEDGLLVRERDVSGMAVSLANLMNDPQLRERLGKNAARRACNQLDLQAGTKELEKIYDAVLKRQV